MKRGKEYFLHPNGEQINIPLSLGVGTRDEVLESCCAQVATIEKLLEPSRRTGADLVAALQSCPVKDFDFEPEPLICPLSDPVKF